MQRSFPIVMAAATVLLAGCQKTPESPTTEEARAGRTRFLPAINAVIRQKQDYDLAMQGIARRFPQFAGMVNGQMVAEISTPPVLQTRPFRFGRVVYDGMAEVTGFSEKSVDGRPAACATYIVYLARLNKSQQPEDFDEWQVIGNAVFANDSERQLGAVSLIVSASQNKIERSDNHATHLVVEHQVIKGIRAGEYQACLVQGAPNIDLLAPVRRKPARRTPAAKIEETIEL